MEKMWHTNEPIPGLRCFKVAVINEAGHESNVLVRAENADDAMDLVREYSNHRPIKAESFVRR